tara:strand:- start:1479 stop:2960 length:1482 start_codon:yes stop_codon:yes gene_type:complete
VNINYLVKEWAWRVNNGMPDPKNRNHLELLESVLRDNKYSEEFISAYINSINESKGVFDLKIVQQLGGTDITQDDVDKIYKLTPATLVAGSKNTYNVNKKEWSLADIKSAMSKEGKIIITTAGSITKVRTSFGERICQLSKKVKQGSDKHLSRVHTLLKLLQMGAEIKGKIAPGIGYENMQIENLEGWMKTNLGNKKSLPLFIKGKNTGVKIDGGAKVDGVPKSDLAFGVGGKPTFFISYKHGAMFDPSGNELKAAFQQYGSISSFYNKKFTSQIEKVPGVKKMMDGFVEAVRKAVQSTPSAKVYENVTEIKKQGGKFIVISNGKEIVPEDQNAQIWAKHMAAVKSAKPKKLYVLEGSDAKGWSRRRSVLKAGQAGKDVAMMSIFGNDYFTGKPGTNNCNILMQDNTAFSVGFAVDADGTATAVHMDVSSAGHIMWNPKIYGGGAKFPSFSEIYEPYLVARYTGESRMKTKDGLMIGVRLLIMPASQTKGGDI